MPAPDNNTHLQYSEQENQDIPNNGEDRMYKFISYIIALAQVANQLIKKYIPSKKQNVQ